MQLPCRINTHHFLFLFLSLLSLTYPSLVTASPNPNAAPNPQSLSPSNHPQHYRAHPPLIVYFSPPIQDTYFSVIYLNKPVNFDSVYNSNNNYDNYANYDSNANGASSSSVPIALKGEDRFQGGGETDPFNGPPFYIQTANVTGGPLDADDVKCAFLITNWPLNPPPPSDGGSGGGLFPGGGGGGGGSGSGSGGSGGQLQPQQQQQQYQSTTYMNDEPAPAIEGEYDAGNWSSLFGPRTTMGSGPVDTVFGISCMAYYRP